MRKAWNASLDRILGTSLLVGGVLAVSAWVAPANESSEAVSVEPIAVANKYIGAKKCKSCHDSDEKGNQFAAWEKAGHARAFATLASGKAKEIAAGKGIADPQKADECLRCHTTAFGVEEKLIKRGFEIEAGVQCESCHGPGDTHSKARFKAAASDDPDAKPEPGEIITAPDQAVCLSCHNSESPTFKAFCFYKRVAEVRHLRPGSDTSEKLVCGCGECTCTGGCPDDGCGVPAGK